MTENTRISRYTKYNMAHREERRQYAKQYYHDNKEELLAKVQCNRCNSIVSKMHMHKHQQTLKCKNFNESDGKVECDIRGSKVVKDKMFNHKATVGCLTAYFSKVFERSLNKADQMRYDYLMKKRLYFKIKNAERKHEAQCASNEN